MVKVDYERMFNNLDKVSVIVDKDFNVYELKNATNVKKPYDFKVAGDGEYVMLQYKVKELDPSEWFKGKKVEIVHDRHTDLSVKDIIHVEYVETVDL